MTGKVTDLATGRTQDAPASPSILWNLGVMLKRRVEAEQTNSIVEIRFATVGEADAFMQLLGKIEERK